jgi:glycogen operon protein
MLNAYWEPLRFELPPAAVEDGGPWRRWIDTSLPSPEDVVVWEEAPAVAGAAYLVRPRSMAFLGLPPGG